MTLGERLKALRGKHRQNEMSIRYGIHPATLSRYENDGCLPTTRHLILIADVHRMTVSELLTGVDLGEDVNAPLRGHDAVLQTYAALPLPFDELEG